MAVVEDETTGHELQLRLCSRAGALVLTIEAWRNGDLVESLTVGIDALTELAAALERATDLVLGRGEEANDDGDADWTD